MSAAGVAARAVASGASAADEDAEPGRQTCARLHRGRPPRRCHLMTTPCCYCDRLADVQPRLTHHDLVNAEDCLICYISVVSILEVNVFCLSWIC